jgi:hypothetical protein
MNRTGRKYTRFCLIAMLAGVFLMASEMPLLANTSEASQSGAGAQKPDDALPEAPQSQPAQTPSGEQPAPAPSGAAGAKAANVKGAPVARPTGAAVAPARQRGHHSLLIKVGLVAGAAIAVGSVVALSQGKSQARPPGVSSAIHP